MVKSGLKILTLSCARLSDKAWLALPESQKGEHKNNQELHV